MTKTLVERRAQAAGAASITVTGAKKEATGKTKHWITGSWSGKREEGGSSDHGVRKKLVEPGEANSTVQKTTRRHPLENSCY